MMSWKTYLVRAAIGSAMVGVAVFAGVRLAVADPGGPTRDALTFAGVLRERAGTTGNTLTFVFHKGAAGTTACTATTPPFAVDANGAFSVAVPLGGCPDPRGLFDGDSVVYDVRIGSPTGEMVASDVAITPVPYARFADQVGANSDCPAGYTRDTTDVTVTASMRLCVRTVSLGGTLVRDEVVKVGSGASAFWVDRYEASVHFAGTGVQLAVSNPTGGVDGPAIETSGLTPSGQRPVGNSPAWALSHPGLPTVHVTWFQANEACAASGKRLLQRDEWFRAASGTVDGAMCNVSSAGARASGPTNGCISSSGAHDMIGNVTEWTGEWYASVGQITSPPQSGTGARVDGVRVNDGLEPWPAGYGGDGTWNISSTVSILAETRIGIPAAALRGGASNNGTQAGVFALALWAGPAHATSPFYGFRCVVPR